ncbi:cellulase family glycosylhydrolase [Paenibacillus sp. HJL G12]|uniref:Cellulase family glycosylhydrolase n=1 Tax=Paenibacillus dendrobii TaxID=2691084 RepID=A0A7X3LIF6_9BACL|nr:cellulase family glycosylhydrolase [Paenibacillus dendrobii]MWV46087.1 cellulase family glycosylhydrolase [Paenibacillus dendrobii]
MKKLKIDGQRIVNEDGQQVILSGVNLVCKEKEKGYVTPCGPELFAWFREQGFNVIRLGLIWDGVEPEPSVYDDVYLGRIKQQIHWAEQHDIYVFLDMHQDLYSSLYGDGAPGWATLHDNLPHAAGSLWSDAYLESPAVNRSLDQFWANAPAGDGIGLQDHYAAMWRHAAAFFADCPNIIGYDIMNEPYPGTQGQEVFGRMIAAYAREVMGQEDADMSDLAELWFDEEKKQDVLAGMADMGIYRMLVDCAKEASQRFEENVLAPFFGKTGAAIRMAAADGFLMLESSYFSNMGVESGLALADAGGSVFPGQIFAPHGYDLVVDTEHYEIYNQERVELIFATHRKVQERLDVPVLIGEWGAFTHHGATYELAQKLIFIFEKYLWSNTYWCWCDGFREAPYRQALQRAYPQATGGVLNGYHYDYDTGILTMDFISTGGETVIYHPRAAYLEKGHFTIDGASDCKIEIRPLPESGSGCVAVCIPETGGEVSIRIAIPSYQ